MARGVFRRRDFTPWVVRSRRRVIPTSTIAAGDPAFQGSSSANNAFQDDAFQKDPAAATTTAPPIRASKRPLLGRERDRTAWLIRRRFVPSFVAVATPKSFIPAKVARRPRTARLQQPPRQELPFAITRFAPPPSSKPPIVARHRESIGQHQPRSGGVILWTARRTPAPPRFLTWYPRTSQRLEPPRRAFVASFVAPVAPTTSLPPTRRITAVLARRDSETLRRPRAQMAWTVPRASLVFERPTEPRRRQLPPIRPPRHSLFALTVRRSDVPRLRPPRHFLSKWPATPFRRASWSFPPAAPVGVSLLFAHRFSWPIRPEQPFVRRPRRLWRTFIPSTPGPPPVFTDGQAHYRFESNLDDSTGYGRHLIGSGDEAYGSGKLGLAMIGGFRSSRQFNEIDWLGPWSIFAWVNLPVVGVGQGGGFGSSGVDNPGSIASTTARGTVFAANGPTWRFFPRRGATSGFSAVQAPGWHHVGLVYVPGIGVKLYIDAVQDGAAINAVPASNDATGVLVADPTGNAHATPIDELDVYGRALTQQEIDLLYNGGNGFDWTNPVIIKAGGVFRRFGDLVRRFGRRGDLGRFFRRLGDLARGFFRRGDLSRVFRRTGDLSRVFRSYNMPDIIQYDTRPMDTSEGILFVFSFEEFPEMKEGQTPTNPVVDPVAGLIIGVPTVTVADRVVDPAGTIVPAGKGVQVTIQSNTPGTYPLECRVTFSGSSLPRVVKGRVIVE